MQFINNKNKYGVIAKLFHWLMALAIIGMLAVGFIMTAMSASTEKFELYKLHKATGVLLLITVFLRFWWKARNIDLPIIFRKGFLEILLSFILKLLFYTLIFGTSFFIIFVLEIVGFNIIDSEYNLDNIKAYFSQTALLSLLITFLVYFSILSFFAFAYNLPYLPENLKIPQKFAAHITHGALYILMFFMPLSGIFMSQAAGFSVSVFDWFIVPEITEKNADNLALFKKMHYFGAISFIGLIVIHFFAALIHHFYYKDNVLKRMLPFGKV